MNALKKIFLLTLISVSFLSAFSQISSETEILARISIDRSVNLDEPIIGEGGFSIGDDIQFDIHWPWWWLLYREVRTEGGPGSMMVTCYGFGWKACIPYWSEVWGMIKNRGIQAEVAQATFENIFTESEELAANGVYTGSLSKKIAITGDRINYILMQLNWNYDPRNPYNGQAEIIISKTNNLGF